MRCYSPLYRMSIIALAMRVAITIIPIEKNISNLRPMFSVSWAIPLSDVKIGLEAPEFCFVHFIVYPNSCFIFSLKQNRMCCSIIFWLINWDLSLCLPVWSNKICSNYSASSVLYFEFYISDYYSVTETINKPSRSLWKVCQDFH